MTNKKETRHEETDENASGIGAGAGDRRADDTGAGRGGRDDGPLPLYVTKETVKAYKHPDKESKVLKKLSGGDAVMVELVTKKGDWCGILIEDTKKGGQKIAWVLTKYLSEEMPQSFCKHDFGKWTVEIEPTCEHEGYRYRFCKLCGIRQEDSPKKLDHEWGKWKVSKEATCTKKGERVRKCRGCGFEQHEIIEPGTVFERGRRGEDVRALQQIIKEVGYDAGSFDDIYGKKLDAALAGFAQAEGMIVEEGKVRPADVDAVVNAWFETIPADTWMGEGDVNSPVNLALTVTFENASTAGAKTIAPMVSDVDVNNLADGIYPVSFDRGDVFSGASGIYMNAVHIYTQDWYDIVDVNTLAVGDTIVVEGEEVPVLSLDNTEYGIEVNADQDARAFVLASQEDSNGFFIRGLDDMTTYTDHGETALMIAPEATFTDAWDIEKEPVTVNADGIVEAMQTSENDAFTQFNTTARVENGKVVEINRVFVP